MSTSGFELSVSQMPSVRRRLEAGQYFNAYETRDGWCVGIGPVTDFAWLTGPVPHTIANLLVDALRIASAQPEQVARASPDEGAA